MQFKLYTPESILEQFMKGPYIDSVNTLTAMSRDAAQVAVPQIIADLPALYSRALEVILASSNPTDLSPESFEMRAAPQLESLCFLLHLLQLAKIDVEIVPVSDIKAADSELDEVIAAIHKFREKVITHQQQKAIATSLAIANTPY